MARGSGSLRVKRQARGADLCICWCTMTRHSPLSALALAAVLAFAGLGTRAQFQTSWAPGGANSWGVQSPGSQDGQGAASWGSTGAGSWGSQGAGSWGSTGAGSWGSSGAGSWGSPGAGSWGQAVAPWGGAASGLFASMANPWAASGSLWGRGWEADQPPRQDPILSCSSKNTPIHLKVVIQTSRNDASGGWGFAFGARQARQRLSALVDILPGEYSGRYKIVITENAGVEEGCRPDKLNNILPVSNRPLASPLQLWGGGSSQSSTGVLRDVTLRSGQSSNINIDSLPYDRLDYLAGRAVALCEKVVTDRWGREKCQEETPIPACCKLGYDLPH